MTANKENRSLVNVYGLSVIPLLAGLVTFNARPPRLKPRDAGRSYRPPARRDYASESGVIFQNRLT